MPALPAPAKINLSLEILGRRTDGFHELVSVMQEVTLCDEVDVNAADDLHLQVLGDCGPVSENLALRAAELLKKTAGVGQGAGIELRKQIPVGAGLGGGSSDAATTLIALNQLWKAGCDCQAFLQMATALGSDVPFFLTGGTALVSGRGEEVAPLPFPGTVWYLLTKPPIHVSTAGIFAALRPSDWSSGSRTLEVARCTRDGTGMPVGVNGLTRALFGLYPKAEDCFRAATRLAPGGTWVSGSGPTVVSRFSGRAEAEDASSELQGLGYTTFVVRNYPTEDRKLPCRA